METPELFHSDPVCFLRSGLPPDLMQSATPFWCEPTRPEARINAREIPPPGRPPIFHLQVRFARIGIVRRRYSGHPGREEVQWLSLASVVFLFIQPSTLKNSPRLRGRPLHVQVVSSRCFEGSTRSRTPMQISRYRSMPMMTAGQQNDCRDLVLAYVKSPSLANGRRLAEQLQAVTNKISGLWPAIPDAWQRRRGNETHNLTVSCGQRDPRGAKGRDSNRPVSRKGLNEDKQWPTRRSCTGEVPLTAISGLGMQWIAIQQQRSYDIALLDKGLFAVRLSHRLALRDAPLGNSGPGSDTEHG